LRGDDMEFSRAAELNRYSGPLQVFDPAEELEPGESRIERSAAIYEHMQSGVMRLGLLLVESAQLLDRLFQQAIAGAESLAGRLSALGETRRRLRGTHLQAYLEQRELLPPRQLYGYDLERGDLAPRACRRAAAARMNPSLSGELPWT
jgi:hypothetical protein